MSRPVFPFSALVGLDTLRLALQLAAIDHRLSVLVRGDKGAGKTTAVRALAPLLADGARLVNLPIGVTEDRLLGGLDIERAIKGEPALRKGLLTEAHGGVLYVDEVNLLPDHLADALLDAVASGVHIVEREGFSAEQDAAFVLVGSMNPEEGTLRPQLLDRFALAVDVSASMDPQLRGEAVVRRLRFDADAAAFAASWQQEDVALAERLNRARANVVNVECPAEMIELISRVVAQRQVASLRADLAAVRAGRALAALDGAGEVSMAHVEAVLPLVLLHRAANRRHDLPPPPSVPPPPQSESKPPSESGPQADADPERVFAPRVTPAPRIIVDGVAAQSGRGASSVGLPRGPVVGTRPAERPRELDARASIVHAIGYTGAASLRPEDLHEKRRAPRTGSRFIFVVDASGSHAVQQRMRVVKGAVPALLDRSASREDEVMVIAFRGPSATVILEPTRSLDAAQDRLAYLPTGGRTPLADGLELAAGYVTDASALVLLTDGRANVPSRTADAWADALAAAGTIRCPALVIDSEIGPAPLGRARELAEAMHGMYATLDGLDDQAVVRLVHATR